MSGADETRDGVALTNLDQPLFDGAGATKRDLVDYLDAVRDRILPRAAGPAAVGDPGAARPGPVHAEEPAEVHPGLGAPTPVWAEASHREVSLRALRRPAHPAVVRQPAGGRVPPDARPAPATRTSRPTWCSTSTRRRAARSARGPGRRSWSAGADRGRADRGGEDQRRQGRAHLRAGRRRNHRRGGGRGHPGHRGPRRAARPGAGHHRVHPGGPGRQGVPRLRPGPAGRPWWPPTARGSGPACRCRSRWPGTTWTG